MAPIYLIFSRKYIYQAIKLNILVLIVKIMFAMKMPEFKMNGVSKPAAATILE